MTDPFTVLSETNGFGADTAELEKQLKIIASNLGFFTVKNADGSMQLKDDWHIYKPTEADNHPKISILITQN